MLKFVMASGPRNLQAAMSYACTRDCLGLCVPTTQVWLAALWMVAVRNRRSTAAGKGRRRHQRSLMFGVEASQVKLLGVLPNVALPPPCAAMVLN